MVADNELEAPRLLSSEAVTPLDTWAPVALLTAVKPDHHDAEPVLIVAGDTETPAKEDGLRTRQKKIIES